MVGVAQDKVNDAGVTVTEAGTAVLEATEIVPIPTQPLVVFVTVTL